MMVSSISSTLDLRNFSSKLDRKEIKYSSTNSSIKDSINKYNQINLSVICRGYKRFPETGMLQSNP